MPAAPDAPSPSAIVPTDWYTASQAASLLGIESTTVAQYCREALKKGKKKEFLRGKKLGKKKKWHVPGSEILRLQSKWGIDKPGVS